MKRVLATVVVALFVGTATGCSTVAKRGFTELRGAKGEIIPVREAPAEFYAGVSEIRIGRVANTVAPVCRESTRNYLEQALRAEASKAGKMLSESGSPCTLDVDVTLYVGAGTFDTLFGTQSLLVGRSTVRGATATADLLVLASSKALRTDDRDLAEEFAERLIEHISRRRN